MDLSNGFKFVTRSCVNTKEMSKTDDGRELPLFKLDTSSESHPFYTGTQKSVNDMGGRVDKFFKKFGKTAAPSKSDRPALREQGSPVTGCLFCWPCRAAAVTYSPRVNQPTPAIVAQSAVRRLPRLALLLFCAAYVLPGFVGREPWKNADIMALRLHVRAGARAAPPGSRPTLLGQPPEFDALLPYWLGAWAMQAGAGLDARPTSPPACPSSRCWC